MKNQTIKFWLVFISLCASGIAQADIYVKHDADDVIALSNLDADNPDFVLLIADPVSEVTHKTEGMTAEQAPVVMPNISSQTRFETVVDEAAKATALPSALLHAVIQVESGYNTNAISPKGARGLMQLMPDTAKQFAVKNPHDPRQNVMAGAQYLKALQQQFNGDIRLALAAYNAGPATVLRYGSRIPPIAETRQYVPKVLRYYQHLSQQRLRKM